MNLIDIIIPVFNLWDYTCQCLESLAENTPGKYYRVVVADNGSSDATPRECPPLLDRLFGERGQYKCLESNEGFGPACNFGAQGSTAGYLLFLNNDTLLEPGWLPPLLKAFDDDSRLGAVSPLLVYPDSGRVQHAGIAFDPNLHPTHLYWLFPSTHPAIMRRRNFQAISGSALILPRKIFEECGGFYPGYRNGSEDMDLCCSVRRLGKRLTCVTSSRIGHFASMTPGRHDAVGANAHLLNQRCQGCFTSDLHRMARHDGFSVRLTPWLEGYLVSGEELPGPGESTPEAVEEYLQANPLWQPGYDLLANHHQQDGEFSKAVEWQRLGATFYPNLIAFRRGLELSRMAGDEESLMDFQGRIDRATQAMGDSKALRYLASQSLQAFSESGEDDMVALYSEWVSLNSG